MTTGLTPAAALDARLRTEERKALAFCDWALGSPERGLPMTQAWLDQWFTLGQLNRTAAPPTRGMLWRTLLTRLPAQAPGLPEAHPEFADLADLPMRPRIAVLLSLLGLSHEEAAEAMRLSMHAHAEALGAGVPRVAGGGVDSDRWQAWSRAMAAYVDHLPLARTGTLISARSGQGVLSGPVGTDPDEVIEAEHAFKTRQRLKIVAVVVATLLALTFVPGVREKLRGEVVVETRTLDDADTAAPVPVRAVPPEPATTLDPVARDLAFYAWYANKRLHARPSTVLEPLPSDPTPELPESEDAP